MTEDFSSETRRSKGSDTIFLMNRKKRTVNPDFYMQGKSPLRVKVNQIISDEINLQPTN